MSYLPIPWAVLIKISPSQAIIDAKDRRPLMKKFATSIISSTRTTISYTLDWKHVSQTYSQKIYPGPSTNTLPICWLDLRMERPRNNPKNMVITSAIILFEELVYKIQRKMSDRSFFCADSEREKTNMLWWSAVGTDNIESQMSKEMNALCKPRTQSTAAEAPSSWEAR